MGTVRRLIATHTEANEGYCGSVTRAQALIDCFPSGKIMFVGDGGDMEKFDGFCPVTGWVPYGAHASRALLVGTTMTGKYSLANGKVVLVLLLLQTGSWNTCHA
ncbi:hypothetical protein AFLA_005782 [Aspergillus flavus NRRL3357]|nr:hypothetical protein AFLA_005782 [Aspergillus flavus NRRL3357]